MFVFSFLKISVGSLARAANQKKDCRELKGRLYNKTIQRRDIPLVRTIQRERESAKTDKRKIRLFTLYARGGREIRKGNRNRFTAKRKVF